MIVRTSRAKALIVAIVILAAAVPTTLLEDGDAAECEPICDHCHYAHDRVYHAYLDITRFTVPRTLNGTDKKQVEVQLRLHGNVGLGYTTISRGYLILTATEDYVGIKEPKTTFISMEPGFRSFYWSVSGRLEGTDSLLVEVWALGVHLAVEFFESADSGFVTVTNPVNAPPRVSFKQPDGYDDVATNDFMIELDIDDPNADPMLGDFYYDNDRDRSNGSTPIVKGATFPDSYLWNTRGIPNGWYYIHVDVDDQRGGSDSATSFHPVIVSHSNFVPNTELVMPVDDGVVRDVVATFSWRSEDRDGDSLSYEVWMGRDVDHMELVGTTTETSFDYSAADNARLLWTVTPNDGEIRGWCRNGPRSFTTNIEYPVEIDLILPANGAVVPGPDVKLVWYGRDLDFEQVLYNVFLDHEGTVTRLVRDWDDPSGPVLVVTGLEPGETYTWWVEGDNPYSTKGVSERWTFTIARSGVPVVDLVGETLSEEGVTIMWSPSFEGTPPVMYDVHIVDHVRGDLALIRGTTATTTTLHDLQEDAQYHWYVIPFDEDGKQGYSTPSFRTFSYDLNSPPIANISQQLVEMVPGRHVLEWTATDPDGDPITFDVYMDPWNATTLIAANITVTHLDVDVEADRIYRWRVVPRDAQGIGEPANGIVTTGPNGTEVGVSGSLLFPGDNDAVAPPVVNLSWEATDPLNRTILFDVYIVHNGSDPLHQARVVINATLPWWIIEVGPGTMVSWAVEARPLRGPVKLLGVSSFTVAEGALDIPIAVLQVADGLPGAMVTVEALKTIKFNATGSFVPGDDTLEYWFDFGDGRGSGWLDDPSAEHTYLKEGLYNATLVVRALDGTESIPALVRVEVEPGDLSSAKSIPGPGALWALITLLATAMAILIPRGRRGRGALRGGDGH